MKTIKIILTTLVTLLISLNGFSQKPNDIITQENYSDEFLNQLIVESLIQESLKYGITLIYNDDCDSAARLVVNKALDLGLIPLDVPEIAVITSEYIANKEGRTLGTSNGIKPGAIMLNGYTTYESLSDAIVNNYLDNIIEHTQEGDTIKFGFELTSFDSGSNLYHNRHSYLVYIVPRD